MRLISVKFNEYVRKISEIISDEPQFVYIQTFGCLQNVSDSEKLLGILSDAGYKITEDINLADVIIFNTCAIRENAEDKVFGLVGELSHLKERKKSLIIGICGCMTQQVHIVKKIKNSYPQVDFVAGTLNFYDFSKVFYETLRKKKRVFNIAENQQEINENIPVFRKDVQKALVPIMYGCNNFCTYCIVPYVRGREESRSPEKIIAEVKKLVLEGCKEITLLGQNVNSYSYNFPDLLRKIDEIEGDFWVRFVSSHPKDASKDLIDAIVSSKKICKHLHLPFQAGSDRILQLMNRKYCIDDYKKIVDYARKKHTDFSFSSDIIVGFPSETYEEVQATKDVLKYVKFDTIYTFVYSKRTGTKASLMEDNISDEQKGKWLRQTAIQQHKLLLLQKK